MERAFDLLESTVYSAPSMVDFRTRSLFLSTRKLDSWWGTVAAFCWQLGLLLVLLWLPPQLPVSSNWDRFAEEAQNVGHHYAIFAVALFIKVTNHVMRASTSSRILTLSSALAIGWSSSMLVKSALDNASCRYVSAAWFLMPVICKMSRLNSDRWCHQHTIILVASFRLKIHFK